MNGGLVVPLYITMFACRLFDIDMLQFVADQTGAVVAPNALARDVIKERRQTMGIIFAIGVDMSRSLHQLSKPAG